MAQLAERSPTISEDPGSNPVIGNFYLNIYLLLTVCRKDENKEKEAENGPFFLKKKRLLLCRRQREKEEIWQLLFCLWRTQNGEKGNPTLTRKPENRIRTPKAFFEIYIKLYDAVGALVFFLKKFANLVIFYVFSCFTHDTIIKG